MLFHYAAIPLFASAIGCSLAAPIVTRRALAANDPSSLNPGRIGSTNHPIPRALDEQDEEVATSRVAINKREPVKGANRPGSAIPLEKNNKKGKRDEESAVFEKREPKKGGNGKKIDAGKGKGGKGKDKRDEGEDEEDESLSDGLEKRDPEPKKGKGAKAGKKNNKKVKRDESSPLEAREPRNARKPPAPSKGRKRDEDFSRREVQSSTDPASDNKRLIRKRRLSLNELD